MATATVRFSLDNGKGGDYSKLTTALKPAFERKRKKKARKHTGTFVSRKGVSTKKMFKSLGAFNAAASDLKSGTVDHVWVYIEE